MSSGMDDLVSILEWLMESKTPPNRVNEAMQRLRMRAVPNDASLHYKNEDVVINDLFIGKE